MDEKNRVRKRIHVVPTFLKKGKYEVSDQIQLSGERGWRISVNRTLMPQFPFPVPIARAWGVSATVNQRGNVAQLVGETREKEMETVRRALREDVPVTIGEGEGKGRKGEGKRERFNREIREGTRRGLWDRGRGRFAWWLTDVRRRTEPNFKKQKTELLAVTMVCYAELRPPSIFRPAQFPRVWRRTIVSDAKKYYLLAPETFALIEFMRQEMDLPRCSMICLPRLPVSLQIEAKLAIEERWRPAWWADWDVAKAYEAYGEIL